jgi:S-adenosylmethionine decarboxylase
LLRLLLQTHREHRLLLHLLLCETLTQAQASVRLLLCEALTQAQASPSPEEEKESEGERRSIFFRSKICNPSLLFAYFSVPRSVILLLVPVILSVSSGNLISLKAIGVDLLVVDVVMESSGSSDSDSSSSSSIFRSALLTLLYGFEDVRPHGGIVKFQSAAYSNVSLSTSLRPS